MSNRADEPVRDELSWAATVFPVWVVAGLFVDGWAHNAGKPEDFWTPWHAVLYSGFVAGALSFAVERQRRRRAGLSVDADPWMLAGFGLFAVGGVGDAVWHSLFGIEEDVAALLSPTHLLLMLGGLLLVTGPLRADRRAKARARWWQSAPEAIAVLLAVAVVGFFLQFASAFHLVDPSRYTASSAGDAPGPILGVVSVLVTNALLLGAVAWLLARWSKPPLGMLTFVVGGSGLVFSSLLGFEHLVLALAPVLGGAVGDVLVQRGAGRWPVLASVPAVLWSTWFLVVDARIGLGWELEFSTGTVVLSVLTGAGLALLSHPPAVAGAVRYPGPMRQHV